LVDLLAVREDRATESVAGQRGWLGV